MKRKPISLIKKKVNLAIQKEQSFLDRNRHSTNPQIIEMRIRAEGRLEALEAVKFALNGIIVDLNMMSRNFE